jgi:hypothetical protein
LEDIVGILITVGIAALTFSCKVHAGIEGGFICSTLVTRSLAYIDPGVGSMLFQILIAGLVAFGYVIKVFWKNIKSFFSRLFTKDLKKIDENE